MADLLRSQIKECCTLALPEGLKDLMSDISREVLRAQPSNLYQFIADYLSALLVARENLSIAAQLCMDVCEGACYPELDDELRFIGLNQEDAEKVKMIIVDYFEAGGANETNLMIKIANNTSLNASQLPAVKEAVRKAFQRNLINNTVVYETSSDSDLDEVSRAAKHTLQLYRKTKHNPEEYDRMTSKVQASYRAYGVKSHKSLKQPAEPPSGKATAKSLRFSADVDSHSDERSTSSKPCFLPTVSSTTLAGSYLNLPKHVPYSVHDKEFLEEFEEASEKENATIDYVDDNAASTGKKISFQDVAQEIEDQASPPDDDSEKSIVEMVYETDDENETVADDTKEDLVNEVSEALVDVKNGDVDEENEIVADIEDEVDDEDNQVFDYDENEDVANDENGSVADNVTYLFE